MVTVQQIIEHFYTGSWVKRKLNEIVSLGLTACQDVRPAVAITLSVYIPKLRKHLLGLSHEEIISYFKQFRQSRASAQNDVSPHTNTSIIGDDNEELEHIVSSVYSDGDKERQHAESIRQLQEAKQQQQASQSREKAEETDLRFAEYLREGHAERDRLLSKATECCDKVSGGLRENIRNMEEYSRKLNLFKQTIREKTRRRIQDLDSRTEGKPIRLLEQQTIDIVPN